MQLPLAKPQRPLGELGYSPSVGRWVVKVNIGYTVTAQLRHRVEASCHLLVGVQSRLMGSKKALRKKESFSNSKPSASWRNEEACLG